MSQKNPQEFNYQIFCINLKRSSDRKQKMLKEFAKFGKEVTFIDAVDGNTILDENNQPDYIKACAMSHFNIYKKIAHEKIPYAMICEDDIKFKLNHHKLSKYIQQVPKDFDICYLYYSNIYKKISKNVGKPYNYLNTSILLYSFL